ncbi:MAG: chromosome segregation protein SMC [Pseudomonadota bacterium]
MQFTKLRLTGFKSFVDPIDLPIEPGITGIVGPNGCGKSNLVEALRWSMGENSARRVRGREMDDVIFAGGGGRPARNLAEVVLIADNSARTAPPGFNEYDELEISRHIERGAGSTYRVNGRVARARDIQILFQDHQTGSTSPALVGQGQIGAIVGAKPSERRRLLEEAAGISGLHSRRHEAELRLNAAETNLQRLDDILATMADQLTSLKKQARQAARYRSLSDRIRAAEATLYLIRWQTASNNLGEAEQARDAAERAVADCLTNAAAATNQSNKAEEALPPLRQAEAAAAAKLQRVTIAREQLATEEERLKDERERAQDRLTKLKSDDGREKELAGDATRTVERLSQEADQIAESAEGEDKAKADAATAHESAVTALREAESELDTKVTDLAANDANRQSLETRRQGMERRLEETANRIARLKTEKSDLAEAQDQTSSLATAETALEAAQSTLNEARQEAQTRQEAVEAFEMARETAQQALQQANRQKGALQAEIDGLMAVLDEGETDLFPPLIDAVTVDPGYEVAFAAAIAEDAMVPLDEAAPSHWSTLPPFSDPAALPAGVRALSDVVKAPKALTRRLAHIGVVDRDDQAANLVKKLSAGQQLVSKDGGHWRWDGLVVAAGEETAAAKRLRQRNRLIELRPQCAEAANAADEAEKASKRCETDLADARAAAQQARDAVNRVMDALDAARNELTKIERRNAEQASQLQRLENQVEEGEAAQAEAKRELSGIDDEIAALPDLEHLREAVQQSQERRSDLRSKADEANAALDAIVREAADRARRLENIAAEKADWAQRSERAAERIEELAERITEEQTSLDELMNAPDDMAQRRDALQAAVDEAELERKTAADALARAETAAREAHTVLREAEEKAVQAREARATAAGRVQTAAEGLAQLRERLEEKLECRPLELRGLAGLKPDAPLPEEEAASSRTERLYAERENMGAVNLRAEEEAKEAEEKIEGLETEKADVEAAIAELRRGIANLNKEAKERLTACFDQVDEHFRSLFTRLFGGGKAYLKLTDPDDPLNAGLEIFASPPGKRLQALSLLSGGERALTALALLFAVFLTNPSPICVLDEVDAPLDDANVDRFCTLVEELVAKAGTRFLIVTHHRMTMARVDRLIGVTMPEAGVSQIVTVDLDQAVALRDSA